MKVVTALLALLALAAAYSDIPDDPAFFDGLLKDEKAIRNLFGCLLDKIECDEFGTHAKGHMADSITNSCKDCDPMQKHYTRLMEAVVKEDRYKDLFEELMRKYDPKGVFLPKLEESVKDY